MIKIVRFDEILSIPNTYNLALGMLLPNGSIDFETITNNGDRNKILSTVASIIFVFLEKYPGNKIYIQEVITEELYFTKGQSFTLMKN